MTLGLTPRRRRPRRAAGLLLVAPAMLCTTLIADADAVAVAGLGTVFNGPYSYTGSCESLGGATTDFQSITFAIRGEGDAAATNGAVATAATVTCIIEESGGSTVYGTVSDGLPGPDAEAVGTVTIPL